MTVTLGSEIYSIYRTQYFKALPWFFCQGYFNVFKPQRTRAVRLVRIGSRIGLSDCTTRKPRLFEPGGGMSHHHVSTHDGVLFQDAISSTSRSCCYWLVGGSNILYSFRARELRCLCHSTLGIRGYPPIWADMTIQVCVLLG